MKFKVDENLPTEVADLLAQSGHDAATVLSQKAGGGKDEDIAALCRREGRAILTLDTDFADIRSYPPADFPGLVVFRLQRQDKRRVLNLCGKLIETLPKEKLAGQLWIVEEERIRIRSGEPSQP
jgi:predicted nuclease of predicted toxin-antitoxin system